MILNECSPSGAIIKLGEYDKIPMFAIAMPPLCDYKLCVPDSIYLKRMLRGLLEAFPSYSQDFFLYYLYNRDGVHDHFSIEELSKVVLKSDEKPRGDNIIGKKASIVVEEKKKTKENSKKKFTAKVRDKENIQDNTVKNNSMKNNSMKNAKPVEIKKNLNPNPAAPLSIEKYLSYTTPIMAKIQENQKNPEISQEPQISQIRAELQERGRRVATEISEVKEIIDQNSSTFQPQSGLYVVNRQRAQTSRNNIERRGYDNFLSGLTTGNQRLFTSEERSESMNDEDYEYTQLNTSTLEELNDLEQYTEEEKFEKNHLNNIPKADTGNELYCEENIADLFTKKFKL